MDMHDIAKVFNESHSRKCCCVPDSWKKDCSKIIKAHTVTKSTSLKKIAKKGKVYGYNKKSLYSIIENSGYPSLKLIGVQDASTFNGFCKKHDNELFSLIENTPFSLTKKKCFLYAYRAFVLENYRKIADSNINENPQLKNNLLHQIFSVGTDVALQDLFSSKKKLEKVLINEDYSSISSIVVTFKKRPSVLVSGSVNPVYGFNAGSLLQDLMNVSAIAQPIYYTLFISEDKSYFVFSWHNDDNNVSIPFVDSFVNIDKAKMTNAIIRFLFSTSENIYLSPDWWDSLGAEKQEMLLGRIYTTLAQIDYKSDYLVDDNIFYDDWNIESVIPV